MSEVSSPSKVERHQRLAGRLRVAAKWLEEHPDFDAYGVEAWDTVRITCYSPRDKDGVAEQIRRVGGHWDKLVDEQFFKARHQIAEGVAVEVVAHREKVCERVVVATREVEVEEPDPQAVAALPKVTRTKVIEDVKWRCPPLLGREAE